MGCKNNALQNSRFFALRSMADGQYNFGQGAGFGWGSWVDYPVIKGLYKTYTNYMNDRAVWAENTDPISVVELPFTPKYSMFMFAANVADTPGHIWGGRIYEAAISQGESTAMSFVPCLDPDGTPCMYDGVTKKPFYNAGPGAFIAGFDTAEQAGKLATLPDVTAETAVAKKSLTVSLPLELAFDASVRRALSIATSRGWTITVQYRESELTTDHIEADFLETTAGGPDIKVEVPVIDEHTGVYAKWSQSVPSDKMPISRGYDSWRVYPPKWMTTTYVYVGGPVSNSRKVPIPTEFIANKVYTGSMNLFDNGAHYLDDVAIAVINTPLVQFPVRDIHIFGYHLGTQDYSINYGWVGHIYEAKITQDSTLINHFIPAIDSTGVPCMYDTVTDQNFYNQGVVGSFIVGFETTEKAAVSLSKLPVTTNGTLTVSLPSAAQDTATLVPAAIDIAKSRGWTIIIQYRTN